MSEETAAKIKIKSIGGKGDEWPMIESLWDFYNTKGIRTVFFSVGTSPSVLADAEIAETIGCPVYIFDPREEAKKAWEEVTETLKTRKRPDTATPFSEGIDSKWILPKNIRIQNTLLGNHNGTVTIAGKEYPSSSIESTVEQICSAAKVENRLDLLKIALGNGMERDLLFTLMNSPYRPGLLLVEWSEQPDEHFLTTCCAGHLQQCGYALISKINRHFLYIFHGTCSYEICSWEQTKVTNPLTAEIYTSINRSSI